MYICILRVSGVCTGNYESYYYDPTFKQCVAFNYGGCLGNANRFKTKLDCEQGGRVAGQFQRVNFYASTGLWLSIKFLFVDFSPFSNVV